MNAIARFGAASQMVTLTLFLFLTCAAPAQEHLPRVGQNGNWDFSVWIAGATGEETRNSFTQAQIWTAGAFIGKVITSEIGSAWRRGNLEYGFDLIPVFVQSKIETMYGGGFDPFVLRWNSSRHIGRVLPYIELAGGAVFTNSNLPPPDTSHLKFSAGGGGEVFTLPPKRSS